MAIANLHASYGMRAFCTTLLCAGVALFGHASAADAKVESVVQVVSPSFCANFAKKDGGTWSVLRPVAISSTQGGKISMGPGITFGHGVFFMGVPMADTLDAKCTSPRLQKTEDIKG